MSFVRKKKFGKEKKIAFYQHFLLCTHGSQGLYSQGHLLERSSDLSNSGEFERQTASDNAVYAV